jgi:hypothetical protein
MTVSKHTVTDSIVVIANHLKLPSYGNLISSIGWTLPELTKMIVYDMYLNSFNYDTASKESDRLRNAYKIVFEYAKELQKNGFVDFNKK